MYRLIKRSLTMIGNKMYQLSGEVKTGLVHLLADHQIPALATPRVLTLIR
jgi:hypothetical protein